MSKPDCEVITQLKAVLTGQRYSPAVVRNYCAYARGFLDHLAQRNILVADVTEAQVERYLCDAVALFRDRHGRPPGPRWHQIPCAGIHALLRLVQGQWPPAPKVTCAADALRFTICDEYETWLREERGLARPSIDAFLWEARHFLAWQRERCGAEDLMELSVGDIDRYMDLRALKLTRSSLKSVAERLRSLLRHLHRAGHIATDLSPHIIAPLLYAYEGMPSILERDQIAAVLESARKDETPVGLRDHAILQLLITYGLRAGEIRNLRIEDIDWRTEAIRVRHSKTQACSFLPLMEPVGEAVFTYLRSGRPATDAREIFIRTRAPYRKLEKLYSLVRRRLRDAGIKPPGKCGPHIFRHARAVEMLRASVPQKVIGDLLGHRSGASADSVSGMKAGGASSPNSPFRYCRRHTVSNEREIPCRLAVALAWRCPAKLSSTIRSLSASFQGRRRAASAEDRTSISESHLRSTIRSDLSSVPETRQTAFGESLPCSPRRSRPSVQPSTCAARDRH